MRGSRPTIAVALVSLLLAALAVGSGPAPGAAFPGASGRIAYASNQGGSWDIYSMNADGSGKAALTTTPGDDTQPSFSRRRHQDRLRLQPLRQLGRLHDERGRQRRLPPHHRPRRRHPALVLAGRHQDRLRRQARHQLVRRRLPDERRRQQPDPSHHPGRGRRRAELLLRRPADRIRPHPAEPQAHLRDGPHRSGTDRSSPAATSTIASRPSPRTGSGSPSPAAATGAPRSTR